MVINLTWNDTRYEVDLKQPDNIAIKLSNNPDDQPNAFGAPPFEATPFKENNFIGAISEGSPVNFFNLKINPHGNGTHTECVGHILEGDYSIEQILAVPLVVAELITVFPTKDEDGNRVITDKTLAVMCCEKTPALVVRSLPNEPEKRSKKYAGSNPPYFSREAMQWIHEQGIIHLLTDLPSVDPEVDDGALVAHRTFWQVPHAPRIDKTITEMVYVDNSVEDGLYLLDIQIAPLVLDVSPSRPMLYRMKPIK